MHHYSEKNEVRGNIHSVSMMKAESTNTSKTPFSGGRKGYTIAGRILIVAGIWRLTSDSLCISQFLNESEGDSYQAKDQAKDSPASPFQDVTVSNSNLSTIALGEDMAFGFRNECMMLTFFVMEALKMNMQQILLPSISFADAFGSSGRRFGFEELFDVVHWNSFYPALPRLVAYDPLLFPDWEHWNNTNLTKSKFTKPYAFDKRPMNLLNSYKGYTESLEKANSTERNPAEMLIMKGALRPHPKVQEQMIDKYTNGTSKYMTLHARVEPDMQGHMICVSQKVYNISDIFDMMEERFPDPPAERLFISINRKLLEHHGHPKSSNAIAINNLNRLNRAVAEGLWGGRVEVFEKDKPTPETQGVFGALASFFIAIQSQLFIGTEVSSFSIDTISVRFYRGNKNNFLYRPAGLVHATPDDAKRPPRFEC